MAMMKRDELPTATSGQQQQPGDLLLGAGAEFEGKLTFAGTVRIDAKFKGSIVTNDVLVVGEHARMDADITCGTVIVYGEVNGNIKAKTAVELHHPAKLRGNVEGETCIGACCGSGAGTGALRQIGVIPLSFDNDPSLLSLGLRTGRLAPEDTVCLDGTKASGYLPHTQLGMVLMAGEISQFNQIFWRKIIEEMIELTEKTLVSTGTENEARMVESWARHKGRKVAVIENKRDAFYDNWVCDIRRS